MEPPPLGRRKPLRARQGARRRVVPSLVCVTHNNNGITMPEMWRPCSSNKYEKSNRLSSACHIPRPSCRRFRSGRSFTFRAIATIPPASFPSATKPFNTSSTFANLVDDMPTSSGFATGSSLAAIPLQRVRAKRIGEIRLFIFSMGGLVRVRLDLSVGGLSKPAKSMGGMVQPAITEHFGGKLFHISH